MIISKELFCKALRMLREQEQIDNAFEDALQTVGSGFFIYSAENKYKEALLLILNESVNSQYDYIDWWLYEATP